jgi:hypothetical protein
MFIFSRNAAAAGAVAVKKNGMQILEQRTREKQLSSP